jgi:hypothetical protein
MHAVWPTIQLKMLLGCTPVWWKPADISEEHAASIFITEQ